MPTEPADALQRVWYAHDRIRCQQKFLAIAPSFELFDELGNPLLYCKEKIFAIKDDIRLYSDASQETELLRIKQRNVWDYAGVFDLFDSKTNEKIGVLRRCMGGWLSRYEWELLDANDTQIGSIFETGAIFWRRLFTFLPTSFDFMLGGQRVGTFVQQFSLVRYIATMDLSEARGSTFDRRLAFAGALLLMAVESKEDRR